MSRIVSAVIVILSVLALYHMHLGRNNPLGSAYAELLQDDEEMDKINEYTDLFDEQIDRLESRGCPEEILLELYGQKYRVVDHADRLSVGKDNLPFLPVIPEKYMSFYRQVEMVHKDRGIGYMTLDPSTVTNVVSVSDKPYFIFDVNQGDDNIGIPPSEANDRIESGSRVSLTTEEIIALCIHSEVLNEHDVSAPASRVGETGDKAPRFYVDDKGVPCLDWCFLGSASRKLGTPSCKRDDY